MPTFGAHGGAEGAEVIGHEREEVMCHDAGGNSDARQVIDNEEKRQRGPVSRVLSPELALREPVISLGRRLPGASSGHTREPHAGRASPAARHDRTTGSLSYLALLRVGFTEPIRSHGPLVNSYLTV